MVKELRIVVNDELLKRLDRLREYYAYNNNADVVRQHYDINDFYKNKN